MSYSIVYDRQVIKTPSGYTFAVLSGDNNVYERSGAHERRVRSWNCLILNQSEAEILDYFAKWTGKQYQEHFVCRGKWVNDEDLMKWAKNGVKNSHSVEEIKALSEKSLRCFLTIYPGKGEDFSKVGLDKTISTTEEFEDWIKAVEKRKLFKCPKEEIFVSVGFYGNDALKIPKTIPKGRVLVKKKNHYISELRQDGKGWAKAENNVKNAIVFDNYEAALAALGNLSEFRVVNAENAFKNAEKERHFVIKMYKNGEEIGFVTKKTSAGIYHSYYESAARKYTEQEASESIDKYKSSMTNNYSFKICAAM